jgi:PHP family Zn ribbon phosphoesterase
MQWYKMDLHIHTPASHDYVEPDVSYLDILRKAESRGLDIIAITDHNSIAGCAAIKEEIEQLELLERLDRIRPDERRRLDEYRRLGQRLLILPGFEFTATLGFHILGIFPPETTVREIEYILLKLNVPAELLDKGSTEVGATVDVLTSYRVIDEAGGLVIAAHANSTHGVALRGFDFGGQTKIAYTQDQHLHALEVTDLESSRRRTTASFYSGNKPEYPRRMHCIQGSDSHRLDTDPHNKNNLGVGERATEVLLPELSFEVLKALFLGDDFTHHRPYRRSKAPFDHVKAARKEGANLVQDFHESMTRRGGRLNAVLRDVVAFANANGGTIYIGVSAKNKVPPVGIEKPEEAINQLRNEIQKKILPPLDVSLDVLETEGKQVLRLTVPDGPDPPYALDNSLIYLRQESDTNVAVRDEIVSLVKRDLQLHPEEAEPAEPSPEEQETKELLTEPPKTGVEIVAVDERRGTVYYSMKDLRNNNIVHNVTKSSARKLWQYAIKEHLDNPVQPDKMSWQGEIGLWKKHRRGGKVRYDFVQRGGDGELHVYYGVTEDGVHGAWRQFLEGEAS